MKLKCKRQKQYYQLENKLLIKVINKFIAKNKSQSFQKASVETLPPAISLQTLHLYSKPKQCRNNIVSMSFQHGTHAEYF